jgi:hypothetical protein
MIAAAFANFFDKILCWCQRALPALGGRSFLLCVGCGLITSLLVYVGKIEGIIYRDVILGTVGAYIVGTVGKEYVLNKYTGKSPP